MKSDKNTLPRFDDPDVWEKLKKQSYIGKLNYRDYPADEYKYFDRLSTVYREYRAGNVPKEEAQAEEKILLREYRDAKHRASRALGVYKDYQNNIKRIGSLRIEIYKAGTLEGKLRAALEIVGILTGDGDFTERNMKGVDKNET